jgi:integrase
MTDLSLDYMPWAQMTYVHTAAIRAKLLARFKPATVGLSLSALKGILHTCARLGIMSYEQYNKAIDWDKIKSSRLPVGRDLSIDEIKKLSDWANHQRGTYRAFLNAVFALLIGAGLRETETCEALLDGLDIPNHRIRLVGKGDKEGYGVFGTNEGIALERWLRVRQLLYPATPRLLVRVTPRGGVAREEILTPSALAHVCRSAARAAGIEKFSPHDCRRTFCTRLLQAKVPLPTVQRLMRHASPETTMKYDKTLLDDDTRARAEVDLWE